MKPNMRPTARPTTGPRCNATLQTTTTSISGYTPNRRRCAKPPICSATKARRRPPTCRADPTGGNCIGPAALRATRHRRSARRRSVPPRRTALRQFHARPPVGPRAWANTETTSNVPKSTYGRTMTSTDNPNGPMSTCSTTPMGIPFGKSELNPDVTMTSPSRMSTSAVQRPQSQLRAGKSQSFDEHRLPGALNDAADGTARIDEQDDFGRESAGACAHDRPTPPGATTPICGSTPCRRPLLIVNTPHQLLRGRAITSAKMTG